MGRAAPVVFLIFLTVLLCTVSMTASASVVISGTRVIYSSDAKETSVKLNNVGKSPVLIQSWIDSGDPKARPEHINVPFILTPPINRVDPGKGQTLRLSYTGADLPMDRETVYWLNVLEIPAKKQQKENENMLQMAFRSRIKLFFRPAGLSGNANDAVKKLIWSPVVGGMRVTNPTPYYVSLSSLIVNGKEIEGKMISPKSTLDLSGLTVNAGNKLQVEFVNDYGAVNQIEFLIN